MRDGAALLVDGDNVPPDVLGPLLARLERDGPVTERRIFRNWRSSRNAAAWDETSKRHAFERVDRYRTSAGKNASDIALVVTAMDLLHGGTRRFCIASGDTDFAPLVERLRRAGAHVTLVGHKGDGGILTDVADEYVDFKGGLEKRKAKAPAAPPTPAPRRAKPAPPKAAKRAAERVEPGLDRLRAVLRDSYEVARTDGELDAQGWVAVDRLGQIARSVDPGFSLGRYGLGARASLSRAFTRLGGGFEVQAVGRSGNRQYRVRLKG